LNELGFGIYLNFSRVGAVMLNAYSPYNWTLEPGPSTRDSGTGTCDDFWLDDLSCEDDLLTYYTDDFTLILPWNGKYTILSWV